MTLLKDKLTGYRLLLASRSPRRRELLEGAGIDFSLAENFDVDEKYPAGLPVHEVPGFLARLKSEAYPVPLETKDILLTADTVVLCGDKVFGKPRDRAGAVEMLGELSGRKHIVVTGVVLRSADFVHEFSVATDVWFRPLSREETEYYVDAYRPYDKAGAYGIQEWIGYVGIERIEGSFYNVMGLPVQALYVELDKFVDRMHA